MSTKSMRPPPRRVLCPPNATATGNNNNNTSTGFISNTSKNNHNNNKRKEERKTDGLQRSKKPYTTAPNPNPMTRLPKYDKLMRVGSDPRKPVNNKNIINNNNNKDKNKKRNNNNNEEEGEEEGLALGLGSEKKSKVMAGYLAHEYLTRGTILGRRWDPSQRVEPQPQHEDKYESYVKLAGLLKTDAAYFAGVVNPTQLAQHLRLLK